jgi:hypothetical protein
MKFDLMSTEGPDLSFFAGCKVQHLVNLECTEFIYNSEIFISNFQLAGGSQLH